MKGVSCFNGGVAFLIGGGASFLSGGWHPIVGALVLMGGGGGGGGGVVANTDSLIAI